MSYEDLANPKLPLQADFADSEKNKVLIALC